MTNTDKLDLLNNFRKNEGKAPFADWRKARHQPMLDAYMAGRDEFEMTEDELAQQTERGSTVDEQVDETPAPAADEAADEAEAPVAETPKLPSYKEMMKDTATSTVVKPVAFVHAFCDAHPDLTRKQATAELMALGINFSTARTQYQKWYTANKAKA